MAAGGVDPEYIRELFACFGPVSVRRMFGGAGLFVDGTMFGLVFGGIIHLKADAGTILDFERENCAPFSYATKTGTRTITSYWRLPERLYDDPDELAQWARAARDIALRKVAPKRVVRPRKTSRKSPA